MKLHFHNKLFISIAVIICMISGLYMGIFSSYIYKNLLRESRFNLQQITTRTAKDLETVFDDMDKLSLYISTNPDVIQAFLKAKKADYNNHDLSEQISMIMTSINIPNNSARYRINLFNRKGNFISTGIPYNSRIVTDILTSGHFGIWYDHLPILHNKANFTGLQKDKWSNSTDRYLSLYREIFDSAIISQVLGIIEVQCPYEMIDSTLTFKEGEQKSYLFDKNGKLVYSSDAEPEEAAELFTAFQKNGKSEYAGGTYGQSVYSGAYMDNGWCLIVSQPQTQVSMVLKSFTLFAIAFGLSALAICLAITFIITKHSTKPLRDLTEYTKQVTLDNLSLDMDYGDYSDEVSNLNYSFQKMFDRLKKSMDENVQMKAYEMRANMIALQSQIDPHFLYNILSVIKSMSHENKTREIGAACDYLVSMLRYTADYAEETVTLEQELGNAESYLKLMKFRYESQFTYEIKISPEIDRKELKIPKLIIQPVLENCFQHGFKKVLPPWQVSVECWQEKNKYYISVSDNGSGMSQENTDLLYQKLEDFLSDPSDTIASLKIGGMGLINTIARLRLRYKEETVFDIVNLPEGGTRITIGGIALNEYFTG